MIKVIKRLLGLKGSWKWALKQMINGKIIRPSSATGTVKYRFSVDKQNRIEWTFDRKDYRWNNANIFYSDFIRTDWIKA